MGEKHYIRDAEEKLKGFFYLLVRSLPVGAPSKSSLEYFYLSSYQSYWQSNKDFCFQTMCYMKERRKFPEARNISFPTFLSLNLKRVKADTLPLSVEIKSVQ